jgi:GntR family transcriptional regulator, N-acetylglucosamine utilization regulator
VSTIPGPVMAALDPGSGAPLYLQVERNLQRRIDAAEWQPGHQIPTEGELCLTYGVSRATIRQALARLTDRGILLRERGRGTFVRDTSLTAGGRGVTSFTAELAALGLEAGARVLERGIVTAGEREVADPLQTRPEAPLLLLRRLRTGGGLPIGIQTTLLPLERFPGLDGFEFANQSLYTVLRETYGVAPVEAIETFTVVGVNAGSAALLEVAPGSHAFHVDRLTFDARGPFEYASSVMRGDRYRVRLVLREP